MRFERCCYCGRGPSAWCVSSHQVSSLTNTGPHQPWTAVHNFNGCSRGLYSARNTCLSRLELYHSTEAQLGFCLENLDDSEGRFQPWTRHDSLHICIGEATKVHSAEYLAKHRATMAVALGGRPLGEHLLEVLASPHACSGQSISLRGTAGYGCSLFATPSWGRPRMGCLSQLPLTRAGYAASEQRFRRISCHEVRGRP